MGASTLNHDWDFEGSALLRKELSESHISTDDICLVGSSSLSVRGLREHNDIDICVRERHREESETLELPPGVSIAHDRYRPIGITDDDIIDDTAYHDRCNGFKIVRPEITLRYKKYRNRPKDAYDVELLEEYRESSDDWNEQLYQSISSGSSASMFSRGVESIRNDGIAVTAIKTAGFLERKYPVVAATKARLPHRELRSLGRRFVGITERRSAAEIINEQYINGEFAAFDLVIRWDLLVSNGEPPSNKRPSEIFGDAIDEQEIDDLRDLAGSDRNRLAETPLQQNHRLRVINPNVFATQLWAGVERYRTAASFRPHPECTESWLSANDVPSDVIDGLQTRRVELLERTGALFYAILWPPAMELHDEIEDDINGMPNIRVVDRTDREVQNFAAFVRGIYDAQAKPTSSDQIDNKIELMAEFGNRIRVLTLELPTPRIRDGISLEMEMIKNDVRQQYIDQFSDELYYSILHVTDNYADNRRTKDIIDQYA